MNITAPPRSIWALRSSFALAVIAPVSILISSICLLSVTLINSFLSVKTEAEDVFSLEVKSGGCIISLITITSSLYSNCVSFLILLWCKCLQKLFWYLFYYPAWLDFCYFSTSQHIPFFKLFFYFFFPPSSLWACSLPYVVIYPQLLLYILHKT